MVKVNSEPRRVRARVAAEGTAAAPQRPDDHESEDDTQAAKHFATGRGERPLAKSVKLAIFWQNL